MKLSLSILSYMSVLKGIGEKQDAVLALRCLEHGL